MIAKFNKTWIQALSVSVIVLLATPSVSAKTIVNVTGECSREVINQIEIWANTDPEIPYFPSEEELEEIGEAASYGQGALEIIAAEWAAEIESVWNGPTWEQVAEAAEDLGLSAEDMESATNSGRANEALRKRLDDRAREMIAAGGSDMNCASVNCCDIYFKSDIKVRSKDDEPTADYHQIEVMTPGSRSFVRYRTNTLTDNQQGTSGAWGYRPGDAWDASAAHETGHLMGLDDRYFEEGGNQEGHDHNVMNDSYGWPHGDELQDILSVQGAACDCCNTDDLVSMALLYNRTYLISGDAILTRNCDVLRQLENDFSDQLGNIQALRMNMVDKMKMADNINKRLEEIRKALEDCGDDDDTIGSIGGDFEIFPELELEYDSPEWCTYRTDPPTIFFPEDDGDDPRDTPPPGGTPPETPGTTPPEQPGTTPPEDDGDDPRDTGGPCEEELALLNRFMKKHGDQLEADASNSSLPAGKQAQAAHDLAEITGRIGELKSICGDDADDPRDTDPPSDGDDPRDTAPPATGTPEEDPCERLKFLRMAATHIYREIENPRTTTQRRGEAQEQLDEIAEEIKKLEKLCPEDGGDDPRDTSLPEDGGDDPRDVGAPEGNEIVIYVKAKTSLLQGQTQTDASAIAGQQVKLFAPSTTDVALPGTGVDKPQTDHNQDPIQGTTNDNGELGLHVPIELVPMNLSGTVMLPGGTDLGLEVNIDTTTQTSTNVAVGNTPAGEAVDNVPGELEPYVSDATTIGGDTFVTFTYPSYLDKSIGLHLDYTYESENIETNYCRDKQASILPEEEPLYRGKGAWKQSHDNQWAIKRVGLTADKNSAWHKLGKQPQPVIVAVIDSGLDWNHLDFSWENIWQNPKEIPDNHIDDDANGYVDDMIGWDFFGRHNKPWDHDGHGTLVAGIIAADSHNGVGIAGMNPHVRIMVLKALNGFGHTRASFIAKAITYAADNGARIINLSVGGKNLTAMEKKAVDYAHEKNVLIISAAGNEGIDVSQFGPAGNDHVLTVAATDMKDERTSFSNWGAQVDIAAPGMEVLSLRARRTDTMLDIPGVDYERGANYVGGDRRYYRASGTSFAAPIVTGAASLLLSSRPHLTSTQVQRMLVQSALDIDVPGIDQHTGYGLLDINAAIIADPDFYIEAGIRGVQVVQVNGVSQLRVLGHASADRFKRAWLEIGKGKSPKTWKRAARPLTTPALTGVLDHLEINQFRGSKYWVLKVVVEHRNGKVREARFLLTLG